MIKVTQEKLQLILDALLVEQELETSDVLELHLQWEDSYIRLRDDIRIDLQITVEGETE